MRRGETDIENEKLRKNWPVRAAASQFTTQLRDYEHTSSQKRWADAQELKNAREDG